MLSISKRRLVKVDLRYGKIHACQSDLRVSHAGSCNESLLQSFVLQSAVLLMSLSAPF